MSEHQYVAGDFHVTVFSIQLRDGHFRAGVVVRRVGKFQPLHRKELYDQCFTTRLAAREHGEVYADNWLRHPS